MALDSIFTRPPQRFYRGLTSGKLILTISLLISHSVLFCQWSHLSSNTKNDLYDISLTDSLNLWAIGDSATILNTTDSGLTWNKQTSPVDTVEFRKIKMIDKNSGYIITNKGSVLKTEDGGKNWTHTIINPYYRFENLCFVNRDTGWIAGYDLYDTKMKGTLFYTSNGGTTWIRQFEIAAENPFNRRLVVGVNFLTTTKGWILVSDNVDPLSPTYIYKTTNGGRFWQKIGEATNVQFTIKPITEDTLWVCPGGFGYSVDGGRSWEVNPQYDLIFDVAPIDGSHGWITSRYKVLYTTDGGLSWNTFYKNTGPLILALENIGNKFIWAVGRSGLILKYTNHITSVQKEKEETLELSQNYPNPFNNTTIIKFKITEKNFVSISVFNSLGEKINCLLDKELFPDIYRICWDGKDHFNKEMPSGVYYYRIQIGSRAITNKAVLIK